MAANKNPDDELIGQTIGGRYRIISRLGQGGMGTTYRAWDEQEGVPVVIKFLRKDRLHDPQLVERFRREIRLLQGLRHPHIAAISDAGEHNGLPYVVMRFLPGGSLSNRRLRDDQGKPRPNPAAMLHLWLPAVAEALDYVHSQGVVHRDVKPANIFFDAFWGAYLGDFGIAKIVEESETFDKEHTLTATHMGIGTQEYMCPEQFTPKAVIDGRADQYALAVMVYEMLAGGRPFTGATAHLIVEVTSHPVPPLQVKRGDLPSSLVQAVHKGLAKNPADRFATCREFATAVLRDVPLMEDEPGVARLSCPKCVNILKLTTDAAGQEGKCPKCQTAMKVAEDLGALWLLNDARNQQFIAERGVDSETGPDLEPKPVRTRRRRETFSVLRDGHYRSTPSQASESGKENARPTRSALFLFTCLWLSTPYACWFILDWILSGVHRVRNPDGWLSEPLRMLVLSWVCVGAIAAFAGWTLDESSQHPRIVLRLPKALRAVLGGLFGLLGSVAIEFASLFCLGPNFIDAGLSFVWGCMFALAVGWLGPNRYCAKALQRWLGAPSRGSVVMLCATLSFAGVFVLHDIVSSRVPQRPPPRIGWSPPPGETEQARAARLRRTSATVSFVDKNPSRKSEEHNDEERLADAALAQYSYFAKPMTWSQADATCRRMKGHLLVIETAEELEFIRDTFGPVEKREPTSIWIGGRRDKPTAAWKWIDKRNQVLWWATYDPVDLAGILGVPTLAKNGGNRLAMLLDGSSGLVSRSDTERLPFICEW